MIPLSSLAQAFGLTLAHSLWQITLIWLVFKLLEWRFNGRHQLVYLLSLTSMLAAALWAATTFTAQWAQLQPVETAFSPDNDPVPIDASALIEAGGLSAQSWWTSARIWLENHAAPIGWAWLICTFLLWMRLVGGWWLAQRLRRKGVVVAVPAFQDLCEDWAKRLRIYKKIQLLESPHISEPLTLGFWKPVVLFPVGMLLQLSPAQVETLLLHELAHIRRHDYLINLFQLALEVCFFYHPLFWLLSREARSRREFCCDEVVMRHTADPILYAKTLTDLQLSSLHPSTTFVMNATGKSRFTERILHIAGISPKRTARPNWVIVMMLPAFVALCSWWPSKTQANPTLVTVFETTAASDTTPPRKTAEQDPSIARPKNKAESAPQKAISNPADDEESRKFFEAVQSPPPNVAMEAVKMNIFYIGVDNPLRVAVAGYPANELQASIKGNGSITGSNGEYIVRVTQPGEVEVVIKHQVGDKIDFIAVNKYRVKRIPDPMPKVDWKYPSGTITPELMQQTKGINLLLANFDFDAECKVVGFEATYLPKEEDPTTYQNEGGAWNSTVLEQVKKAKSGDAYYFDDIRILCPGDTEPRNVGGLAFKIKAQ